MMFRTDGKDRFGDQRDEFYRRISKKKVLIVILVVATVIATFVSFTIGTFRMPFSECIDIIIGRILDGPTGSIYETLIWEDRIPRGVTAALVGAGLSASGCVMQSMMRNPLADPYTTGVSSGASLGAAIAIVLGFSILPLGDDLSIISNAFVMSLIPSAIILVVSTLRRVTPTTMILIGIGVMFMFSSCTQLLEMMADPTELDAMYRWQLGSMGDVTAENLVIVLAVVAVCTALLYRFRTALNLMTLGDESALTLGTDPWKTRIVCMLIISFMTAVVVSYTGVIGFVGLVAPQIIRVLIGSDIRYLLPTSAVFGGLFLVLCDTASRVIGEAGLPVGVVTAFVGSPLFLYLLVKQARRNKLRG